MDVLDPRCPGNLALPAVVTDASLARVRRVEVLGQIDADDEDVPSITCPRKVVIMLISVQCWDCFTLYATHTLRGYEKPV